MTTLAPPDDAHHLISFVSGVLLATVRDPYTHIECVERILYESMEDDVSSESTEHYSLQEILGKWVQEMCVPPRSSSPSPSLFVSAPKPPMLSCLHLKPLVHFVADAPVEMPELPSVEASGKCTGRPDERYMNDFHIVCVFVC